MFKNLAELAELARQPFGAAEPQVFRGAFELDAAFFSPAIAYELYADNAFRSGEFEPGHNKMHLVLDQRLVPPGTVKTLEAADRVVGQGATMTFHSLQRHMPAAAAACQVLANAIGEPVHVNAYWSAGGTQQYPLHADAETVFAVQLSGSKTWPIFRPLPPGTDGSERLYWARTDGKAQEIAPPDTADYLVTLQEGDILAMPRRHGHYATAGREGSLHLSFCVLHAELGAGVIGQQRAIHPA